MKRLVLAAIVLGACDPPQPALDLELASGPGGYECPSTDCDEIPMTCRMFMGVRILDPDDRTAPYHSECIEIPMTDRMDLCPLGGLELQPHELPYRDLEVQVAIYPADAVQEDTSTGVLKYICPAGTTYDAVDGFPISDPNEVMPALGGRGYYRPGDDTIHVTLGCSDVEELDRCGGVAAVTVTATVEDFDTHLGIVGTSEVQRLTVSVGQPKPENEQTVLSNADLTPLHVTTPPAWSGTAPELFTSRACLAVLDDTPQSTTSVTCKKAQITETMIDLSGAHAGVRLNKASLDQILDALSLSQFPLEGLTVGVVVDGGVPVPGQVVTAVVPNSGPPATIEYLSSDRSTVGPLMTSGGPNGGVFVSRDAPFDTVFSTTGPTFPFPTATKIGGLIRGKVTIVVLDLSNAGIEQ